MDSALHDAWCRSFAEPLARALVRGPFTRVEIDKDGGYWLHESGGAGNGAWWHLDDAPNGEVAEATGPVGLFGDRGLKRAHARLDAALARGDRLELLAHRPGRRAVVRLIPSQPEATTPSESPYLKFYRRDRDTKLRWTTVAPPEVAVPRIHWDAEARALAISPIAGEGVNERWRRGGATFEDGTTLATVVTAIAGSPGVDRLPAHTTDDEVAVLERELAVSERLAGRERPRRRELVARVVEALRGLPDRAPVVAHRDLHDKQILVDERPGEGSPRCGVIDWDLAAAAPPGLDAGNLLAHIRLRGLEFIGDTWRGISDRFQEQLRESGGVAGSDLAVWTASTLVRLVFVCERRAREHAVCDALIEQAHDALARRVDWEGLGSE